MRQFLFLLVVLNIGCASIKQKSWLTEHQTMLQSAALNMEDPEAQMDVLTLSLIQMMNEALDFTDPQKGLQFINKYKDQNQGSINTILGNLESWFNGKDPMEQISTGLALMSDSNVKEMVALIPKFEKKYKQIQFFSRMTNRFKKFLFGN